MTLNAELDSRSNTRDTLDRPNKPCSGARSSRPHPGSAGLASTLWLSEADRQGTCFSNRVSHVAYNREEQQTSNVPQRLALSRGCSHRNINSSNRTHVGIHLYASFSDRDVGCHPCPKTLKDQFLRRHPHRWPPKLPRLDTCSRRKMDVISVRLIPFHTPSRRMKDIRLLSQDSLHHQISSAKENSSPSSRVAYRSQI